MATAPFTSAPAHDASRSRTAESLALQAEEDIERIRDAHRAYACVEKLILPQRVADSEEIYPTRSEFGALMRLVNEELQRRIDAADQTVQCLRGVVDARP